MTTSRDMLELVEPNHRFEIDRISRRDGEQYRLTCSCGWHASYIVKWNVMEDQNNLPERIDSWIALEKIGHLLDQELDKAKVLEMLS